MSNLKQLKQNIRVTVTEIKQEMCENLMKNAKKRIHICPSAREGHLSDIFFSYFITFFLPLVLNTKFNKKNFIILIFQRIKLQNWYHISENKITILKSIAK